MARKITCPHCNAETYDTPSCGRCGKPMHAPTVETASDMKRKWIYNVGILRRALEVDANLGEITLVQYRVIQKADGMAKTNLVVERDRHQYVYTPSNQNPVKLGAGQYSLGSVLVSGGDKSGEVGCLICEVGTTPITVTFAFPDIQSFNVKPEDFDSDEKVRRGVGDALHSLSLRSSDDLLGGALLQVRLRCADPIKLISCDDGALGKKSKSPLTSPEHEGKAPAPGTKSPNNKKDGGPSEYQKPKSWKEWFSDILSRNEWAFKKMVVGEALSSVKITLADLYPMIRLELAEAIRNSVRNVDVKALYDMQDSNRPRLLASIKDYMEKTLESFGLQIVDVVAFQFRSPDYEEVLQRRGDVSLQRQDLESERQEQADAWKRWNKEMEDSWIAAQEENSVQAYERFLGKYPSSKHVNEANELLSEALRHALIDAPDDAWANRYRERYLALRTPAQEQADRVRAFQGIAILYFCFGIVGGMIGGPLVAFLVAAIGRLFFESPVAIWGGGSLGGIIGGIIGGLIIASIRARR